MVQQDDQGQRFCRRVLPQEVLAKFQGRRYDVLHPVRASDPGAAGLLGQSCPIDMFAGNLQRVIDHVRPRLRQRPVAWDDIITREQERQVEKVMMREHARLRGDPEGRLSGRSGENDLVIQNAVHNEAFRGHKWYLGFAREADDPRMQVPIQDIPRHAPYCHTAVVEGLALAMPDKEIAQVLIDGADAKDGHQDHAMVCHNHGSGIDGHALVNKTHREEVEAGRIQEYRLVPPGASAASATRNAARSGEINPTRVRRGAAAASRSEGVVDVWPCM